MQNGTSYRQLTIKYMYPQQSQVIKTNYNRQYKKLLIIDILQD